MPQEQRRTARSGGETSRRSAGAGKKRSKKKGGVALTLGKAALYVLFVIGISALLATLGWNWANDVLALNKEYSSVIITVEEDEDFDQIVDTLKEEGIIQYPMVFKLYAFFSSAEEKIAPGTYALDTDMDYRAIVTNMSASSATRQTVNVTIPEGYTIDQIFQLLEDKGVSSVEKLQDMAANYDYKFTWLQGVIPLGEYTRLEGYLFPDTYTFYMGEDPKYVINKMLANFERKMEGYFEQIEESGYTLADIVTIASMIEKETDGDDQAKIASVIYNRLEGGATNGHLQIDSTLVYINGGRVPTEEDKSIDSPYNTYLYPGLPAGPIANPGMEALYAALEPESTNYYYYALGDDGKHHFFRTYQEHQNFIATQELYQ